MTTIFRMDSSIRKEGSVTRAIADTLVSGLVSALGDGDVIHRDLGLSPLPPTIWGAGAFARYTPPDQLTDQQRQAQAIATELADELLRADAYVFAAPLYNFGVSQHIKTWIDIILTEPRFAPGAPKLLEGRPAYLIVARGGGYGEGTPRHGWDHGIGWLKRILTDVFALDLQVIESELTLADVTPGMESLRELAAQNLQNAHASASEQGQLLATQLRGKAAE